MRTNYLMLIYQNEQNSLCLVLQNEAVLVCVCKVKQQQKRLGK